jgi:flagellar biosynthetic protein FlhB
MSADANSDDKTEEPTEKRLHDAIERGEVAFSREAPLFASLSATLVALIFVVPGAAQTLLTALVGVIDDPAGWRIERGEDILALAGPVVIASARFLLPTVVLLTAAGVFASLVQSAPRIVVKRIMPDASRISLRNGLRRILGPRGWTEFLKSLIKLAAVIAVAATMLVGQKVVLLTAMDSDPGMLPRRVLDLSVKAIAAVLVATVTVAAADLAWSRILWRRDNRMSKQELKDELRQAEGDRLIKARLRSLRLDRSRKRRCRAQRWLWSTRPTMRSPCATSGPRAAPRS